MKLKELFKKYEGDESQWISMSDMMTGLMVIFLLLFVISTIAKTQLEDDINKTENVNTKNLLSLFIKANEIKT